MFYKSPRSCRCTIGKRNLLSVGRERLPCWAFHAADRRSANRCPLPRGCSFRFLSVGCKRVFAAREGGDRFSSQRRNPPRNALLLSPARVPGGNSFSFLTLPPPRTTSSGSRAAIRQLTASATLRRHFFAPYFSNARTPT